MLIDETVAIFIAATTGQGVEPDNMRRFWRFLMRKSLPSDSLSSLKYAVFGTWITCTCRDRCVCVCYHAARALGGVSIDRSLFQCMLVPSQP